MPSSGLNSLLWFIAIIALIPCVLWLLKRTPMGGGGGQGLMRSIAVLPLSNSQKLVAVEVGSADERRWLVLGVTPQQITTLHSMAPQDIPALSSAAMAPPQSFAQLLARMSQRKGPNGDR